MKIFIIPFLLLLFISSSAQWTLIPSGTIEEISAVDFASANVAYFSRGFPTGTLHKSTDAGLNWSNTGTSFPFFRSIHCTSVDTLHVLEYTTINYSYNGGTNWQAATITGASTVGEFFAFDFPSDQIGYATGMNFNWDSLLVFKTTNAGLTWNRVAMIEGYYYADVFFTDDQTGFMTADGYIYKTTNGGVTWTPKYSQMGIAPIRLFFPSPSVGYAISELGDFLKSTDGGENWTLYNSVLFQNDPISTSSDLFFVNDDTGYVVSEFVGSGVPAIQYTINGGLNWSVSLAGTNGLQCIEFYNETLGLAGGASGELRRLGDMTALIEEGSGDNFQVMQLHDNLYFNFLSGGQKTIAIYDLSGKVILTSTVNDNQYILETTTISSGLFICLITENGFCHSKKIAITR